MPSFTPLEEAVLHSIFAETPDVQSALEEQLRNASVLERENSGAGFFTTIDSHGAERLNTPHVLGLETCAEVAGLEHGLGFVLFMKDGRLDLLEGYTFGSEDTSQFDLANLSFKIFRGSEWLERDTGSTR